MADDPYRTVQRHVAGANPLNAVGAAAGTARNRIIRETLQVPIQTVAVVAIDGCLYDCSRAGKAVSGTPCVILGMDEAFNGA